MLGNLAAPSFVPAAIGASAGARAAAERAVILRGGPILTVDEACPVAEALAIRGSRILAVGSATDVKRHFTATTEILDLEGRAVLPGFVEPHVSVLGSALAADGGADAAGDRLAEEPECVAELCAATLREFAARGCTTVYDTGIGRLGGLAEHELLRTLARAQVAPVRVRGALVPELASALGAAPGAGDDRYDVAGIAYWVDGAMADRAAALRDPYLGGGDAGALNYTDEELREALRGWQRAGWQLVVHAHGDRANEQVLRCFEAVLADAPPGRTPHRIEHFTLASDEQAAHAAALGLSVSHAINEIYFRGEQWRDEVLGAERAARIHSLLRDVEHEICSSCHSGSQWERPGDCTPIGGGAVDPLLAIRTAMTRLMRDSDDVLGPFQQLDLGQALRMVTRNPARQVLLGDRVGVLRAGMLADLVVLDRDPREVAPERLHELRVLETWLGGRRQRWSDLR
ncbi:MAG TPA: amidohydrolase family protein [Solirubrobacteraceae bacterium]|nr:amidohydrolase family protein [Solirubrobacteraceae bacterium]